MTNEELVRRLLEQTKYNHTLNGACRKLMEAAAQRLLEDAETPEYGQDTSFSVHEFFHGAP